MKTIEPTELVTVAEAARRMGAVSKTLKRHIDSAGLLPDAVMHEGAKQIRSPLFVSSRLPQLASLLEIKHPAII